MPWVKRSFVFAATVASTIIEFQALYTKGWCVALDNVQVRAIQSSATAGTGVITGTLTLQLAAPTIVAGSQQTVQGTGGNNASVALVVDYPNGTQLLAPLKAGADGHYTYKLTVPTHVHGTGPWLRTRTQHDGKRNPTQAMGLQLSRWVRRVSRGALAMRPIC